LKYQLLHRTEENNVNRPMSPDIRTMPICLESCEPGHVSPKPTSKYDIVDHFADTETHLSAARTGQLPFGKCYNQTTIRQQSADDQPHAGT
jgi:hypothetical protein